MGILSFLWGDASSQKQKTVARVTPLMKALEELQEKEQSGEIKKPDYNSVVDGFIAEGYQFDPLAADRYGRTEAMYIIHHAGSSLERALRAGMRFNPTALAFGDQSEALWLAQKYYGAHFLKFYKDHIMDGYEGPLFNTVIKDNKGRNLVMMMVEKTQNQSAEVLEVYAQSGGTFDPAAKDNFGRTEAMYIAEHASGEHIPSLGEIQCMATRAVDSESVFSRRAVYPILADFSTCPVKDFRSSRKDGSFLVSEIWSSHIRNEFQMQKAEGLRVFLEHGGVFDSLNELESDYFMKHSNEVIGKLYRLWYLYEAEPLPDYRIVPKPDEEDQEPVSYSDDLDLDLE